MNKAPPKNGEPFQPRVWSCFPGWRLGYPLECSLSPKNGKCLSLANGGASLGGFTNDYDTLAGRYKYINKTFFFKWNCFHPNDICFHTSFSGHLLPPLIHFSGEAFWPLPYNQINTRSQGTAQRLWKGPRFTVVAKLVTCCRWGRPRKAQLLLAAYLFEYKHLRQWKFLNCFIF